MEDYVRQRHIEEGFDFVSTPHITKDGLFHTSGHLPYYADSMFPPMELEGAEYRLKAMNCPMHNLIYRSRGRSYRELPLRLFEFGQRLPLREVRRRARPHPGARADHGRLAQLLHPGAGAGRDQAPARTSARPVPRLRPGRLLPGAFDARRHQTGQVHRHRRAVGGRHRDPRGRRRPSPGCELVPDPGGAAYYGPKISVQARDAIGRTWQMSTIQYDFNQPARFELEYQAADGTRQQPGDDPLGASSARSSGSSACSPSTTPARSRPGSRRCRRSASRSPTDQVDYLDDVAAQLRGRRLRVEVDASDDRMQKKIRTAQQQKVPFMLIAGADRRRGRRGLLPLPRRQRSATAIPVERGRRQRSRTPWPAGVNASPTAELYDVTGAPGSDFAGRAGRVRPALDAAPAGLHQGREQAGARRRRRRLPVLLRPGPPGRGRPDRARAASTCTRCSTCTRTTPGT